MKLSDILTGPDKWTKGAWDWRGKRPARLCLVDAIYAIFKWPETTHVMERASRIIDQPVARWNDDPERTWEDVAELIRKLEE